MRCKNCKAYTLQRVTCPYCGGELSTPHPPRYIVVKK
ncbi:MAG: RNA-protein complex protein Nop10 [Aigarchaeota archaeon]|nr:RNA-protein complex protein Nop10 [Aigarchaeota archaeon]MDW8092841.1 nucleolar RNA-binding Nop10p family protein [Nitrososphaerota archaeon]